MLSDKNHLEKTNIISKHKNTFYILMNEKMEFEGIIIMMWNEETVWQNNLRKLTFVIEEETDREFKWSIAVDVFGDKVDMMKDYKKGDKVKVGLNFRAREYNGRWFNGVSARRIDKANWATAESAPSAPADDDLPF